ncbi:hypothetical protein Tco_0032150 [Tanacetum coccineum]
MTDHLARGGDLLLPTSERGGVLPQPTLNDTFYNGLNLRHRVTIKAAAGGKLYEKATRREECYDIIEKYDPLTTLDWDTSAQRE